MLIINYDVEMVADIFLYALPGKNIDIGAYDILCNGQSVISEVVKLRKNTNDTVCVYLQMMQRALIKAADYNGKAILVVIDPEKKILQSKKKKIVTPIEKKFARFFFKFHIPDADTVNIMRYEGDYKSVDQQKLRNLLRMMIMDIENAKSPFWNLHINVLFEFKQCPETTVAQLAEYVKREAAPINADGK